MSFFNRSLFGSNPVSKTSLECHKRTIFDTMRQISTMVVTVFIAAYQHIMNKLLARIQNDKVHSRRLFLGIMNVLRPCVACNSVGKIMRHVSNRMRFADVVPSSGVELQVF